LRGFARREAVPRLAFHETVRPGDAFASDVGETSASDDLFAEWLLETMPLNDVSAS
jgi:hypothetical protein